MPYRCLKCDHIYAGVDKRCPACGECEYIHLGGDLDDTDPGARMCGWLVIMNAILPVVLAIGSSNMVLSGSGFLDITGGAMLIMGIEKAERLMRMKLALTAAFLIFLWVQQHQQHLLFAILTFQPLMMLGLLIVDRTSLTFRLLSLTAIAYPLALGSLLFWLRHQP